MSLLSTARALLLLVCTCSGPLLVWGACGGKIDVVICLDGSGSISSSEYKTLQSFAKDFINDFSGNGNYMGEDLLKFGVMVFSSKNVVMTNPQLTANHADALAAVDKARPRGATQTHLCIKAAQNALNAQMAGFNLASPYM